MCKLKIDINDLEFIGEGRFSKVYLCNLGKNTKLIIKVILLKESCEQKFFISNDFEANKQKILNYYEKLVKAEIKLAEVYSIFLENENMYILQKYVSGISLDRWVEKNFNSNNKEIIIKPLKRIIDWFFVVKKNYPYTRIDINLPNYIVDESRNIDSEDSVYLVDIIPVLDTRDIPKADSFYEKCIYNIKYSIESSLSMFVGYSVYNIIYNKSVDETIKGEFINYIYYELMKYIESKDKITYNKLFLWEKGKLPTYLDEDFIPAIRLWGISNFTQKKISLEKLVFIFNNSSISKMRNCVFDKQHESLYCLEENIRKWGIGL